MTEWSLRNRKLITEKPLPCHSDISQKSMNQSFQHQWIAKKSRGCQVNCNDK